MKKSKYFDYIEKYLFDQMTPKERAGFEGQVAENQELAQELAIAKMEHRTMLLLREQDLSAQMQEWKKEKQNQANKQRRPLRVVYKKAIPWAVAASVLLLISVFTQQWASNTYGQKALASNFHHTSVSGSKGDNANQLPLTLQKAISEIIQKNYDAALVALDQTKEEDYQETVLLLKGECYFQTGKNEKAIEAYQAVIEQSNWQPNKEEAEWNLLSAYLAANYSDFTFRPLLEKMVKNENHNYHNKAKELQAELESFWYRIAN